MSFFSKAIMIVTVVFLSSLHAAEPPNWDAELIYDDFNDVYGDPINRTSLGAIKSYSANNASYTKGKFGYWYVFSGDGGLILNPGDVEITETSIESAFDMESKCIHVKYTAEGDSSYAAIASNIFNEGDWVDLSKMTSLFFKAKGTGSIRFYFKSKFFKNQKYTWGDIGYSVDLTTSWKEYNVPIADLLPAPWSDAEKDDVTWADCKDSITSLAIEITVNTDEEMKIATEAWVDSIVFKGMKYSDIVPVVGIIDQAHTRIPSNSTNHFSINNNTITYNVARQQKVSFSILDFNGTVIGKINGKNTVGTHSASLPVLSAGNYLVKMNGSNGVSQKLTIVK